MDRLTNVWSRRPKQCSLLKIAHILCAWCGKTSTCVRPACIATNSGLPLDREKCGWHVIMTWSPGFGLKPRPCGVSAYQRYSHFFSLTKRIFKKKTYIKVRLIIAQFLASFNFSTWWNCRSYCKNNYIVDPRPYTHKTRRVGALAQVLTHDETSQTSVVRAALKNRP